jgi:hypothetical protein
VKGGKVPKFLENKLKSEAAKKGFKGRRGAKYVFGAMNNMGAMHGSKETAKGASMERKHEMKMGEAKKRFSTESHAYNFKQHRGGRRPKRAS